MAAVPRTNLWYRETGRFGHWLTLCTLNIHLLSYLLVIFVKLVVVVVGVMVTRAVANILFVFYLVRIVGQIMYSYSAK